MGFFHFSLFFSFFFSFSLSFSLSRLALILLASINCSRSRRFPSVPIGSRRFQPEPVASLSNTIRWISAKSPTQKNSTRSTNTDYLTLISNQKSAANRGTDTRSHQISFENDCSNCTRARSSLCSGHTQFSHRVPNPIRLVASSWGEMKLIVPLTSTPHHVGNSLGIIVFLLPA